MKKLLRNVTIGAVKLSNCRGSAPQNLSKSEAEQRKQMSLQGGNLVEGKECKDLQNIGDGILSLHSWMELMRNLHPLDFGPVALFCLMLEKFTSGQIRTVGQITRMFVTVLGDNASRLVLNSLLSLDS